MTIHRVATAAALFLLSALALLYAGHVPSVVPATAPRTEFSAERALAIVREISAGPRYPGSDEHTRVRNYIMTRMIGMGLQPQLQATTGIGTRYPVAGRVANVIARVPGTRPIGPAVLLMAHYDGVAAGPAAGDDASGTAVLLETLRALRAGPLLTHDVIALFTDAEESGLLGAAAFAREHPFAKDVAVVLNFEARGTHGPSLMFETGAGNYDVVRALRGVGGARATSLSTAVYRALPNDTDLSELAVLGQPAMNFAFIGGVERYHTAEDDIDHLSPKSIQDHGDQALALASQFARGQLPRPRTADAVFFDLPLAGLVLYPVGFAIPIAGVALALVLAAALVARKRGDRVVKDASLGLLALVLSLALAGALAAGFAALLAQLHGALPWGGEPRWRAMYGAVLALVTIAVVAATFAGARRVAEARSLALGALLGLGIISLVLSIVMPGVSFLFVWPTLYAALAALLELVALPKWLASAASWVAAAITIFLFVPTAYLMVCVALGLDQVGGAVLGILAASATWLLTPQMEKLLGEHRWRGATAVFAAGILLLVAGIFAVRTNAGTPGAANLVYAIDADSNTAWVTGSARTVPARRWLTSALGSLPETGTRSAPPLWLSRAFGASRIVAAPRATTGFSAPSATVIRDSVSGDDRFVTLRIRAGSGARSISMSADPGVVSAATVDGRAVDRSRYRSASQRWSLEYVAPSDTGFVLSLAIHAGVPSVLYLLARHSGLPTGSRIQVPARPAGVVPIQQGDHTQIYKSVVIGAAPASGAGARRVR